MKRARMRDQSGVSSRWLLHLSRCVKLASYGVTTTQDKFSHTGEFRKSLMSGIDVRYNWFAKGDTAGDGGSAVKMQCIAT
jgi:hypothetical protein